MDFFQHLTACRHEKGTEYTHTSLGPPHGAFYIWSSQQKQFHKGYCATLERGENLHLAERHRHIGPVVVDLDFRFKPTAQEIADPTKILFGTDYPFSQVGEKVIDDVMAGIEKFDGYDARRREMIFRENALALFPRFAAAR